MFLKLRDSRHCGVLEDSEAAWLLEGLERRKGDRPATNFRAKDVKAVSLSFLSASEAKCH